MINDRVAQLERESLGFVLMADYVHDGVVARIREASRGYLRWEKEGRGKGREGKERAWALRAIASNDDPSVC